MVGPILGGQVEKHPKAFLVYQVFMGSGGREEICVFSIRKMNIWYLKMKVDMCRTNMYKISYALFKSLCVITFWGRGRGRGSVGRFISLPHCQMTRSSRIARWCFQPNTLPYPSLPSLPAMGRYTHTHLYGTPKDTLFFAPFSPFPFPSNLHRLWKIQNTIHTGPLWWCPIVVKYFYHYRTLE